MSANRATWLPELKEGTRGEGWSDVLSPFDGHAIPPVSLHLAVFVEPYLSFILDGRKTIESRFSVRPMPPFGCVDAGDVVLLKESGGPVVGAFTATAAWDYRLDPATWHELRRDFAVALCAQDAFWEEREGAEYATLIQVSHPRRLPSVSIPKRDRRGWVVVADRNWNDRLW
jgi:predicted transcriptional regulator